MYKEEGFYFHQTRIEYRLVSANGCRLMLPLGRRAQQAMSTITSFVRAPARSFAGDSMLSQHLAAS
jgi:hypothetical protein